MIFKFRCVGTYDSSRLSYQNSTCYNISKTNVFMTIYNFL